MLNELIFFRYIFNWNYYLNKSCFLVNINIDKYYIIWKYDFEIILGKFLYCRIRGGGDKIVIVIVNSNSWFRNYKEVIGVWGEFLNCFENFII